MAKLVACIMLLAAVAAGICPAYSQPTVVLVRHGEKLDSSRDPALSPAGEARAQRLMQMLASSGITTIYTTEFRRTELLAAPLARQLGLRPQVVPAADRAALLKKLAAHAHGETVLVVGHSNTVPAVLKGLGHGELVRIDEGEFDNLFVLVPREGKSPAMLRLKY